MRLAETAVLLGGGAAVLTLRYLRELSTPDALVVAGWLGGWAWLSLRLRPDYARRVAKFLTRAAPFEELLEGRDYHIDEDNKWSVDNFAQALDNAEHPSPQAQVMRSMLRLVLLEYAHLRGMLGTEHWEALLQRHEVRFRTFLGISAPDVRRRLFGDV